MWRSRIRIFCPNCSERYAPGDRACGHCGRIRDLKTITEMVAEANTWQQYTGWVWPALGIGVLLFIALWVVKSQPASKSHSAAVVLPPLSAEERAQIAKQQESDAKFWAAKEKREAREVESYSATLPLPVGGAASGGALPQQGEVSATSEDIASHAILGADMETRPVPHSSGSGNRSSAPSQGTRGVSL